VGSDIYCTDVDVEKIERLKAEEIPIYELASRSPPYATASACTSPRTSPTRSITRDRTTETEHHAVMGVELNTDSGPCCVLWTNTFYPYGAEAFLEPITDHLLLGEQGPESWSADDNTHWQARLGLPIRDVTVWWEELNLGPATLSNGEVVEPARSIGVPVALRFDFEFGPVWFVAGIPQWPDMREVFIPGDEIMIVFTGRRMVELGFPGDALQRSDPRRRLVTTTVHRHGRK